jgi:hypothetical protein
MSQAKHSLIANAADMDRAGGGGGGGGRDSQEIRPGIAYTEDHSMAPDSCCIPCTTPLSFALSFVPLCWPILPFGCVPVSEKEEQVLLVFGKYHDTIRTPGMHWVNPIGLEKRLVSTKRQNMDVGGVTNPIKVADGDGNPVIVSGVVGYRITNSKAAALDVENARSFVHTQAQTILKQIVSRYPYETTDGTPSLKSETYEIGIELCRALQEKSTVAGVLIESFELADLSYAPEIAQVMLVRQQAKAMVDARAVVVEGAVGIVQGACEKLADAGIDMDDKEKSKLVTNLLTVICGDQGAQPVVTL